ncbi:MAG TPA: hypothetical protein VFR07_14630 [Mycobacteriales bacterium]|nr:hypothetical protein [Mycobacteriales bacterium]
MEGQLVFWSVNVPDVPRAKVFFTELFGWAYSEPGPSGAVRLEDRTAAFHPSGYKDPADLWVSVGDMAATVARVRELGGTADDPMDTPYGASSRFAEPGGLRAGLSCNPDGPTLLGAPRGHGELLACTLSSSDVERSAAFVTGVFGWTLQGPAERRAVDGLLPPTVLVDAGVQEGVFTFGVDDLEQAAATVRRLGGTAERTGDRVAATDDQGYRFSLAPHA